MFLSCSSEIENELNLCAITSLLLEAQRIKADIRHCQSRSNSPFWTLFPYKQMESTHRYKRGFAAYSLCSDDERRDLTTQVDEESLNWAFEASPFPAILARPYESKELLPIFYESLHPRKIASPGMPLRKQARVFAVQNDKVIEIAQLTDKSEQQAVAYKVNLEFYQISYSGNFSYKIRKTPSLRQRIHRTA